MRRAPIVPGHLARLTAAAFLLQTLAGPAAGGYVLGYTVADMRQPATLSGGTACPQRNRLALTAAGINRQWSTSLGTNPVTVITSDSTAAGRLDEIEATIADSFGVWTGVPGSALVPAALAPLSRTAAQAACDSRDGFNTICLNQSDPAFTAGVLSFTRVVTADVIGVPIAPGRPSSRFVGEILDADMLLRPGDSMTAFATPLALAGHPEAYDLESVLTHELGHFFGFNHSGVWRAMMSPFVPPRGQYLGNRPTTLAPDAPLADDDRTGVRVLYPDPADTVHIGSIRGRIVPANPISLPATPAGVTGIFPAQVVAVEDSTGSVNAAAVAGWSCSDPGPAQFDGSYAVEKLPVGSGHAYRIYVEPFDGPLDPADIGAALAGLCRNEQTDSGWPGAYSCHVPRVTTNFSTRVRPSP